MDIVLRATVLCGCKVSPEEYCGETDYYTEGFPGSDAGDFEGRARRFFCARGWATAGSKFECPKHRETHVA